MDMSRTLIKLMRGSCESHQKRLIRRGNLSIVTDKPELRYHDGFAIGGIPIPIDPEVHAKILADYNQATAKYVPQKGLLSFFKKWKF